MKNNLVCHSIEMAEGISSDVGQPNILAAINHLTNLYYLICHLKIIRTFTLEQPP